MGATNFFRRTVMQSAAAKSTVLSIFTRLLLQFEQYQQQCVLIDVILTTLTYRVSLYKRLIHDISCFSCLYNENTNPKLLDHSYLFSMLYILSSLPIEIKHGNLPRQKLRLFVSDVNKDCRAKVKGLKNLTSKDSD